MGKYCTKIERGKRVIYQLRDDLNGIVAESPDEIQGQKFDRIAACVNALADVENPAAVGELIKAVENAVKNPYKEYALIALDKLHKALAALGRKRK